MEFLGDDSIYFRYSLVLSAIWCAATEKRLSPLKMLTYRPYHLFLVCLETLDFMCTRMHAMCGGRHLTHLYCHIWHIHKAFLLSQGVSFSWPRKPSCYHFFASPALFFFLFYLTHISLVWYFLPAAWFPFLSASWSSFSFSLTMNVCR